MKFEELLSLDDIDKKIISILQAEPELTPAEIAEKILISAVIVESRIMKLKRRNLLSERIGVNFDTTNIRLARIDLEVRDVDEVWQRLNRCPYISNCFKMTGNTNMMIEVFAPSPRSIDHFVDFCLRKDPSIVSIKTNFIITTLHRYPSYISFDFDKFESGNFEKDCWCRSPKGIKRSTKKPESI